MKRLHKFYINISIYFSFIPFSIDTYAFADDINYSYSILGTSCSVEKLIKEGFTRVSDGTWKYRLNSNLDSYLWLENNIAVSEGFLIHGLDSNMTHDNISEFAVNFLEHGHIKML